MIARAFCTYSSIWMIIDNDWFTNNVCIVHGAHWTSFAFLDYETFWLQRRQTSDWTDLNRPWICPYIHVPDLSLDLSLHPRPWSVPGSVPDLMFVGGAAADLYTAFRLRFLLTGNLFYSWKCKYDAVWSVKRKCQARVYLTLPYRGLLFWYAPHLREMDMGLWKEGTGSFL